MVDIPVRHSCGRGRFALQNRSQRSWGLSWRHGRRQFQRVFERALNPATFLVSLNYAEEIQGNVEHRIVLFVLLPQRDHLLDLLRILAAQIVGLRRIFLQVV